MDEWIRKAGGERLILKERGGTQFFVFPALEETGLVRHAFSTRIGGVSEKPYDTMNFSFTRGDKPEHVRENYRRMAAALGVDMERMVLSFQTHTVNIRKVTEEDAGKGIAKERDYRDVDGLITDVPGITLVTFFADCVPLFFVDSVHKAIGLSHSGWRGTVKRMGKVTLEAMRREYGTEAKDVIACIGPSICRDCFEVGEEVAEAFAREFPGKYHQELFYAQARTEEIAALRQRAGRAASRGKSLPCSIEQARTEEDAALRQRAGRAASRGKSLPCSIEQARTEEDGLAKKDKYQLDLWRANEIVLAEAGILPDNIHTTDICTRCNPGFLFSHRAQGGRRGNLAAFLCLNPQR